MYRKIPSFFCLIISVSFYSVSIGQVLQPGTFDYEYYRLLISRTDFDNEPITYFPTIITDYAPDSAFSWNVWRNYKKFENKESNFTLIEPTATMLYNSGMSRSYNDGPLWSGKGLNSSFSGGFYGKIRTGQKGYISYTVNPVIFYAQNSYYRIPTSEEPRSPFSYPYLERFDYVERYGNESLYAFHPGQSELKYVYSEFSAAISTQNMMWGPALFNPILMSQQAAGFPHLDLGTNTPLSTKIGRFEGKVFWGALKESAYYDGNPDNNRRYITGFVGGYAPNFIKGLNLGIQRVMYRPWEPNSLGLRDAFAFILNTSPVYNTPVGGVVTNDNYDQLASFTVRWNLPELGLEMYGEYARNDFPGNFKEFLRNPDRSRAITLAVSESFEIANGNTVKLLYENTTLSANQLQIFNVFASPSYYVHSLLDHGYTHDGQIIGAGIGPGSNTHMVQAQYFDQHGMFGLWAHRIRFNDDYILREYAGALRYPSEFELTYGARYQKFFNHLSIDAQLTYSHRYQWFFGENGTGRNLQPALTVRYLL